MRVIPGVLFGLLLVCVALTAAIFYGEHQGHLHHSVGTTVLITQEEHDRFLRSGIHCEETYVVQGYEAPEGILRMFGLSQQEFHQLNPGVGMMPTKDTVLCIHGSTGVKEEDHDTTAFNWFWPVTAVTLAAFGFTFSYLLGAICVPSKQPAGPDVPTHADA